MDVPKLIRNFEKRIGILFETIGYIKFHQGIILCHVDLSNNGEKREEHSYRF